MLSSLFFRIRRPLYILTFLLTSTLTTNHAYADFIAAVIPGSFSDYSEAHLVITGEDGTTGTITNNAGFSQSFSIGADQIVEIPIPLSAFVGTGTPINVGTVVQEALFVSADKPINGYILRTDDLSTRPGPPALPVERQFSSEVMPLINTNQLGTYYRVLQSSRASGRAGPIGQPFTERSIAIVATADNTTVTYTPNEDLVAPASPAGTPVTATLNAGESIIYPSRGRPVAIIQSTGGVIEANNPVAVFTYISRGFSPQITGLPLPITGRSLLGMQLPPSDKFGTQFVFAKTPYSNDNNTAIGDDIVRVVADSNNTEVRLNGTLITTINAGEFFDINGFPGTESALIETSQPVLAAQYIRSNGSTAFSGPAVSYLPPINQTTNRYLFNRQINTTAVYAEEYLNIAIPTAALTSLTIDGVPVNTASFTPIGSTGFSAGNILLSGATVGEITASQPFTATIAGYSGNSPYYGNYLSLLGRSSSQPASKIPSTQFWALLIASLLLSSGAILKKTRRQEAIPNRNLSGAIGRVNDK